MVDAAQGVTMTLKKTGTTSLSMTRDTESIQNAVEAMVTAYNNLQSSIKSMTGFDTKAQTKGALNGETSIRNIQTSLRSVLNTPEADMPVKAPTMLAAIGVSMQKDGTMAIDSKKLDAALNNNLRDVAQLFAGDGTTGGFARRLSDAVDRMIGESGPIGAVTAGIERSIRDLESRYEAIEVRVNATVERYRRQFTALDHRRGADEQHEKLSHAAISVSERHEAIGERFDGLWLRDITSGYQARLGQLRRSVPQLYPDALPERGLQARRIRKAIAP